MKSIDRSSPEFKSHYWVETKGLYSDFRYKKCLKCNTTIYASKKQNRNKWRVWMSIHTQLNYIVPNCYKLTMDEALG